MYGNQELRGINLAGHILFTKTILRSSDIPLACHLYERQLDLVFSFVVVTILISTSSLELANGGDGSSLCDKLPLHAFTSMVENSSVISWVENRLICRTAFSSEGPRAVAYFAFPRLRGFCIPGLRVASCL